MKGISKPMTFYVAEPYSREIFMCRLCANLSKTAVKARN